MHRQQIAASSRINSIQAIHTNWIYQIMLEIYFFFRAVEHFAICAYRASWNLESEGWGEKKEKKGGRNVPAYIKLAQLNLPKYPVCIWFR